MLLIAGTYNAQPVNTATAIATLEILINPKVYTAIAKKCNILLTGLEQIFQKRGIQAEVSRNVSAYCVYFSEKVPKDLHDILHDVDFSFYMKYRWAYLKTVFKISPYPCKPGSVGICIQKMIFIKHLNIRKKCCRKFGENYRFSVRYFFISTYTLLENTV